MTQIHPKERRSSCSAERERLTVWMKSLVLNGYGCTVYTSQGHLVFRVDNYQVRCRSKVMLMDSNGQVLYEIRKRKVGMLVFWEGYKWSGGSSEVEKWFQVTKNNGWIMSKYRRYEVSFGYDKGGYYRIVGMVGKSTMKIVDDTGKLLAELIQKQSNIGGVKLGDDVQQLIVELEVDRALIMALITVYSLINNTL